MKFFVIIVSILIAGIVFLPQKIEALTISPVRVEVAADPGVTVRGELLLVNEQEGTRTFYSSFGNFEASGETGTPSFVEGLEGLATWIDTISQVTLITGEQKEVSYTIQIPLDADPGGHFAAIFWSTVPPASKEGGGISIGAKIGSLILLRVSGEIQEGGRVLEFETKDKQSFFSSLPVSLIYRFQNGGGDRLKPEGEIKITNLIGFTSAALNANPKDGNVLPQSIRKFEILWGKIPSLAKATAGKAEDADEEKGFLTDLKREWNNFAFGRYTATLNLSYGSEGETAKASTSFFVVPWRILTIVLISLALIGFLLSIGVKRYNKWIIAKARQTAI